MSLDPHRIPAADHVKVVAYADKIRAKREAFVNAETDIRLAAMTFVDDEGEPREPTAEERQTIFDEEFEKEVARDLDRIERYALRTSPALRDFTRVRLLQQRGHQPIPDPVEE